MRVHLLIFFPLILLLAGCHGEDAETVAFGKMRMTFLDVGQGEATLLKTDRGRILIDGGRSWSALADRLIAHDIQHIDLLIATHPHADHIGGLIGILERLSVGEIWYNGQSHSTQTYERFRQAIAESGAQYHEPARGKIRWIGGMKVRVVHPQDSAADYDGGVHHQNIAVRVSYDSVRVLVTGDLEVPEEEELIAFEVPVEAHILQLGHHGSFTSTSTAFIHAVNPAVAVYQASATNQYGHPHQEVLDRLAQAKVTRLEQAGVPVRGTAESGDILFATNGIGFTECPGDWRPRACRYAPPLVS